MQEEALAEKTILRLLRGGDPVAFKAIYDQYWDRLYKVAAGKVPYAENAEEIIQDIFVDLWERRELLVIGDLEHYLFRAVKYKVLDYIRAQMVRRQHEDSVLRNTIEYGDPDIEEELAYRELREAFHSGLNDLPEKTKEIFRLSRVEHFSVREISETLRVPERTVTYHIAQALRILRVCLKDYMLYFILFLLHTAPQ
jgi:RNA polymerase sigma-70 factor (family 1)